MHCSVPSPARTTCHPRRAPHARSVVTNETTPRPNRQRTLHILRAIQLFLDRGDMVIISRPPSPPSSAAPPPGPTPLAVPMPTFDVARIGPDGRAVIAGRAQAGAKVVLLDGGKEIAQTRADQNGEWMVMAQEPPLERGPARTARAATCRGPCAGHLGPGRGGGGAEAARRRRSTQGVDAGHDYPAIGPGIAGAGAAGGGAAEVGRSADIDARL